jgi:hypothetical protein
MINDAVRPSLTEWNEEILCTLDDMGVRDGDSFFSVRRDSREAALIFTDTE